MIFVSTSPWRVAIGALLLVASPWAAAQSWAIADCSALLQTGSPRPVWGSKERASQEALLTLINYQMAISICQQDELIRIQKEKMPKTNELPKTKPSPITALPKEAPKEVPKEAPKEKDADATNAPAAPSPSKTQN